MDKTRVIEGDFAACHSRQAVQSDNGPGSSTKDGCTTGMPKRKDHVVRKSLLASYTCSNHHFQHQSTLLVYTSAHHIKGISRIL